MRVLSRLAIALGILLGLSGTAEAQTSGEIFGLVTDVTGGVLPRVTVTVSGSGLQQPRAALTTMDGAYTFAGIPVGTYSVRFERQGLKTEVRNNVSINAGFSAKVDVKLEVGSIDQQVEVTSAPPLVDTKRTTTGATTSVEVLNVVPTTRDIWQAINFTPGVVLGGVEFDNTINVGGSAAGQGLTPLAFGQTPFGPGTNGGASPNNILAAWNLEGGNITRVSVPGAPTDFNFDSFQEVQVITGGGDASVQTAGLFINIVTKSGGNTLKGSAHVTFENASMQAQNVTPAMFAANTSNPTGLSGNPIHRINDADGDIGGPIRRNRLWYWGSVSSQDINLSIGNFFDTSKAGCNPPPSTYAQLSQIQGCLENQRTLITNFNGKVHFLLNARNRFQFLVQTAQRIVDNNAASPLTAPEATTTIHDAGGLGPFQNPTFQLTHTWIPTDRLVVLSHLTYLRGGMLFDFNDYARCGASTYGRDLAGNDPTDPTCQWNLQSLINNTTGVVSRSAAYYAGAFEAAEQSLEAKADGTLFVPHVLGGDHTLKFGAGWRRDPTLSYSHDGGNAQALVQCVDNTNCGDGVSFVTSGAPGGGLVPSFAALTRDGLDNSVWHTYFGYIQDAFAIGRMTVTAGLRDDWQTSINLGGCVRANPVEPTLLPAQCQGRIDPKQPFNNVAPRASVTYDVTGHATTAVHASFAIYYASRSRLADALDNLGYVELDYSANDKSGACSTVPGASCWNDANHDGIVQSNELTGIPAGPSNFVNGVLTVALPTIDPNLQIGRTREGIAGIDHQLWTNVHISFDYVYRIYDHGSQNYILAPSGTTADSVAEIAAATGQWQPHVFTDSNTGFSTIYYTLCAGCQRLMGATFTTTSLQYTTYKAVSVALVKRPSPRWQGSISYTWNDPRVFTPVGSFSTMGATPGNPTGVQFLNGFTNGTLPYTVKAFSSVALPHGLVGAMNLNVQSGAVRPEVINGPGTVPSGTGATSYRTLLFQDQGTSRFPPTRVLDASLGKTIGIARTKLTFTLNCFNVFNVSTPQQYTSDNASNNGVNRSIASFSSVAIIVPPRVFRADVRFEF